MPANTKPIIKSTLLALGLALASALDVRAAFAPVPLSPTSFNHDVVVEAIAAKCLSDAVNVTVDQGTNRGGNTFYERGYNPAAPTTGIPPAGSLVTNATFEHVFRMPPDYHTNNVIMVGHSSGGQTPLILPGTPEAPATLTFTTPASFNALSFLCTSGNGPVLVGYRIHYADSTMDEFSFSATDWFNAAVNIYNCAGRVSLGGGVQNVGGSPAGALFAADIPVNPAVNITSVDFYFAGSGANNNTNNNGRAMIFAISGSLDSVNYSPIAVTGFTKDVVVEADGPPTTGAGVAAGSILTNNVTATMDGGTNKGNNCWYERGYYSAYPNTGLPVAGGSLTSVWYGASYTMPSTYVGNCAVVLASNVTSANVIPATPAAYGALSFLCGAANGDTFVPCILQFQDGTTESNTIFIPDWFNRALPWAYLSHGRVNPNNRTVNQTPDQFVNPFAIPTYPYSYDMRGLGLPAPRLFDAVINVTNTSGMITNIALSFTNGVSTRVASIFALSGVAAGAAPPIFGAQGTPTTGQPNNAGLNGPSVLKRWEGTNNIVLSVTNIAGSGISYQWKKAPRGGGFRDKFYSFDYSTFADVVDGGRVSGSTSSALVISNAIPADSADYLVIASNPYGVATSAVATVMVLTTNQSLLVGVPAGDVIVQSANDATPTAESVEHVGDRVAQKWLSDGLQSPSCCGGPLPFVGPVGFIATPVSGASIVTSLRFYTANDTQGRDPMDYGLEGSNDGSTWTPITGGKLIGSLWLPTGRNGTGSATLDALNQNVVEVDFPNATGYRSYRLSITNTIDRLRQALMQVAEIELLGTLVANPPVWVRQPDPTATVYVGGTPTFVVTASGYPLPQYQWFKNGSTLIPGATGSSYTFPNAQLADSGTTFSCVASNVFGTTNSTSAALTVIAAPAQSYPVAILANNPIGYWRLGEGPDNGSGNNGVLARDSVGGHNGYYSNVVIGVSGYNPASDANTAARFGDVPNNSYVVDIKDVDFGRVTNAPGATFSVEAWVYGGNQAVDAAIVTKGYNGILNAGTGTGTEQFVLDTVGTPTRMFRFLVRDAAGNGHVAQSAVFPFDPISSQPVWRHVVGVCDQPNGAVYLYVDGQLAGSGSIPSNGGILNQPLPMNIGARKSGGTAQYDNQWQGVIDEVAVYNSALSPSQVLGHLFAAQRPPLISLQPTNIIAPESVSITFYSAAYGPGTLSYQWYLSDGSNPTTAVPGQTSSNLTFTTSASQNFNYYQLVVTNQYGSATGSVAQLQVVSGPPSFFTDLPTSATVLIGHVIQLHVDVGGTAPFTYQWQKNGINIGDDYRTSGSQSNTLIIGYATNSDSGNYQILVSGQGTTPSTTLALTVTNGTPNVPFNAGLVGWSVQSNTNTAAIMTDNRLELTSGLGNTARSAFMLAKQNISSFSASFVYQTVSGAGGADGATFCIQDAPAGAAAIGGGGGSLGYATAITPSVALGLNIYASNTRGIRLLQNGVTPAAGAGAYAAIDPVLIGGNANPVQISLNYSGGVMTASFIDPVTPATFTTNFTVDIPGIIGAGQAYVGFTGADGGTVSTQVITNFTMRPAPVGLTLQKSGGNLVLSWPASAGAFLKSTPNLESPVWTPVTDTFRVVGTQARVTLTPGAGNKFYRLDVYP